MTIISSITLLCLYVCSITILVRNEMVYRYSMTAIEKIHTLNIRDIENGKYDVDWRYDILNKVTYHEMVLKFWKPLDSFYKDKSFLE